MAGTIYNKPTTTRPALRGIDVPSFLYDILSVKSPSGKEKEIRMLLMTWVVANCDPKLVKLKSIDGMGNVVYTVGDPTDEPMFTSHMDTVHKDEGDLILHLTTGPKASDKDFLVAFENKVKRVKNDVTGKTEEKAVFERSILGADDKTGMFIMAEMMKAEVYGTYAFFVQEETGRKGSTFWAKENLPFLTLNNIEQVISFDRMNTNHIITTQKGYTSCASAEFIDELSDRLKEAMSDVTGIIFPYKKEAGTFTDSASFMDICAECTNLSVGYYAQHSAHECQDMLHLAMFVQAACEMNWSGLPVIRDASAISSYDNAYGGAYGWDEYDEWYDAREANDVAAKAAKETPAKDIKKNESVPAVDKVVKRRWVSFKDWDPLSALPEFNHNGRVNIISSISKTINHAAIDNKEHPLAEKILCVMEGNDRLADTYLMLADFIDTLDADTLTDDQKADLYDLQYEMGCVDVFLGTEVVPDIVYNKNTRILKIDGNISPVYTKRGRPVRDVHLAKLSPNTKLFARVKEVLHQVHVVTQEEYDEGAEGIEDLKFGSVIH